MPVRIGLGRRHVSSLPEGRRTSPPAPGPFNPIMEPYFVRRFSIVCQGSSWLHTNSHAGQKVSLTWPVLRMPWSAVFTASADRDYLPGIAKHFDATHQFAHGCANPPASLPKQRPTKAPDVVCESFALCLYFV